MGSTLTFSRDNDFESLYSAIEFNYLKYMTKTFILQTDFYNYKRFNVNQQTFMIFFPWNKFLWQYNHWQSN